jgi:hypothetical protein
MSVCLIVQNFEALQHITKAGWMDDIFVLDTTKPEKKHWYKLNDLVGRFDTVIMLPEPTLAGKLLADRVVAKYPQIFPLSLEPSMCSYIDNGKQEYGIQYADFNYITNVLAGLTTFI